MLITLVIIGVIAALTIPNLMQKYQEQTTVKKLQKFHSALSNAYNLASKEYGQINEWGLTGENRASSRKIYEILFKPYFKISKDCGFDNKYNYTTNNRYKYLNGTLSSAYGSSDGAFYKLTLDDGASVFFASHMYDSGPRLFILYDINGAKEPNQWGKDLFEFQVFIKGTVPSGIQTGTYSWRPFNTNCSNNTTHLGTGCAAWVVYKGNMDYLHCDGLTWKSRSCKDK